MPLKIKYSRSFTETASPLSADMLEVRAARDDGQTVFRFEARLERSLERFEELYAAARSRFWRDKHDLPSDGLMFEFSGGTSGEQILVGRLDLDDAPLIREKLLEIDKDAQLAPRSMGEWLKTAQARKASGQYAEAFQCATIALERGHLPYIRLRIKDDTAQKHSAAQLTFDAGGQAQAVDIAVRLAENYLRVLENAWKRQ